MSVNPITKQVVNQFGYKLKLEPNLLVAVIQNKVSLNNVVMAYVILSKGLFFVENDYIDYNGVRLEYEFNNNTINLKSFRKGSSQLTNNDEFEFKPSFHFLSQMLERKFDLSCLAQIYLFADKYGECKREELFNGYSSICFSVIDREIQLITGWNGKRN